MTIQEAIKKIRKILGKPCLIAISKEISFEREVFQIHYSVSIIMRIDWHTECWHECYLGSLEECIEKVKKNKEKINNG